MPFKKGWNFIFIYHDISDKNALHYSDEYSTHPEYFEKQLDFLQKQFSLVSLDELVGSNLKQRKKNYAAIVFDDGFKSVVETARPILKSKSIPFAVFVNKMAILSNRLWVSELIMKDREMMQKLQKYYNDNNTAIKYWQEKLISDKKFNNNIDYFVSKTKRSEDVYMNETDIIKLKNEGVIIGSHSYSHLVISFCDKISYEKELLDNKQYLDKLLCQDTLHFAIPFGKKEHYNAEVMTYLKSIGHTYVYSSNPIGFKKKMVCIPRIGLTNQTTEEVMYYLNRQFIKKINI
jgi:peptidoglycan/xylan/chitin deacetylase (PgdA/CDA1 family)